MIREHPEFYRVQLDFGWTGYFCPFCAELRSIAHTIGAFGSSFPFDQRERVFSNLFWMHTEMRTAIAEHIRRQPGSLNTVAGVQ